MGINGNGITWVKIIGAIFVGCTLTGGIIFTGATLLASSASEKAEDANEDAVAALEVHGQGVHANAVSRQEFDFAIMTLSESVTLLRDEQKEGFREIKAELRLLRSEGNSP